MNTDLSFLLYTVCAELFRHNPVLPLLKLMMI
jgi:hypothetical protein